MNELAKETPEVILEIGSGTKLSMELAGYEEKLSTFFVGSARSRFIITTMPILLDSKKDAVFQFLYQENRVTMRYLNSGAVQGFVCEVIKYILSPFPLLFLTYPGKIETFNLRRFKRLSCLFQAKAMLDDAEHQGMITDISQGGCSLVIRLGISGVPKFDIDQRFELTAHNFAGLGGDALTCTVKRLSRNGDRLELGLKFDNLSPETRKSISEYIKSALFVIS